MKEKRLGTIPTKQLWRVISVVLTEKCDIRDMSVVELIQDSQGVAPTPVYWGTSSKRGQDGGGQIHRPGRHSPLANRMVHTLSDGERQKVMIAKALAQETPVIYLDEPTALLDFPSKVEMMQLLHQAQPAKRYKTIFPFYSRPGTGPAEMSGQKYG